MPADKPPERFFYTFRSSEGVQVKMLRGDGAPKMTGGGGGWSTVARPRRTALTQWTGRDPYRMDVPILFDGWHDRRSVEKDIARLNRMQMGHDYDPPPTVHIEGAVPIKGAKWVIESIDWGDDVIWSGGGAARRAATSGRYWRLRQDAIVHLMQFQETTTIHITTVKFIPNYYEVMKQGETLKSIAKAMYGNGNKWKDIQKANPKIRDPNKIKVHTKLRIP